jgi:poly(A) polymerase
MGSRSAPPASGLPAILALRRHRVALRVADAARAHGSPAHLVGGMVRDAWLGRPTQDVDAVVCGRGEEIARRLAETLPARFVPLGGKEFAAFRLVGDGFGLDLWDREGMTVVEDLARRDLTVNALALNLHGDPLPESGEHPPDVDITAVVDPFGGLGDLEHRVLRATTPTSFTGDPLRVLRLPRLLSQLEGFRVAEATRALARRAVPGLSGIAAERIREELLRLFAAEGAPRGLREMAGLGLYPGLFLGRPGDPGIAPGRAVPGAEMAAQEMEILPTAAERLTVLAETVGPEEMPAVDRAAARWASAFLHLPATGGGGEVDPAHGVDGVLSLRELGYLGRRTAEPVLTLVRNPRPPPGGAGAATAITRRRALHRLGPHWATALTWWGARVRAPAVETGVQPGPRREGVGDRQAGWTAWEHVARELLELVRNDGPWILDPPRLLTGDEVRELLGLPPGPELGSVLEGVRQAQVDGRLRTREEALDWLTGKSPRRTSSRHP